MVKSTLVVLKQRDSYAERERTARVVLMVFSGQTGQFGPIT